MSLSFFWKEAKERPHISSLNDLLTHKKHFPSLDLKLYNSGVFGLFNTDKKLMQESIGYIDEWLEVATNLITLEQIALSFALEHKQVVETKKYVTHYYASKKYFHAMFSLFFSKYGEHYSTQLLQKYTEIPTTKPFPSALKRLLIKWKIKALTPQEKKIARAILYGCMSSNNEYALTCRYLWWDSILPELKASTFMLDFSQGKWPSHLPHPIPSNASNASNAALKYISLKL